MTTVLYPSAIRRFFRFIRLKLPERVLKIEKIRPEEGVVAQNFSEITESAGKINISKN